MKMHNLDDSENNAKISDSGYSNSCSNSQSRRSRSSKSTYSGSHSSGSSGYGEGKPSASGHNPKSSSLPQQSAKKPPTEPAVVETGGEAKVCTTILEVPAEENVQECPTADKEGDKTAPVPEIMEISNSEINNSSNEGMMTFTSACAIPNQIQIMQSCAPVQKTITPHSPVGFSCVISMHDGIVMYTTNTITAALGFPKDMWIGRSFIDFIHPKDRDTFAAQITNGLAVPKNTNDPSKKASPEHRCISSMVSRIRKYRGITTGFIVKDVKVSYIPFSLKLSFKNVDGDEGNITYLVVHATPFFSAFKVPNEPVTMATPFIIRHSANGSLEYLDPESVPYLGYVPQDMLNKDVLRLYHHEDLPYLKLVYKTIVKEGGMARCKSFRIQAQNGDYVRVETEWLSFINPWTRKLEFVIGKHFIIEGPTNVDVFETPDPDKINYMCHEEEKEMQAQREIFVRIMNEVLTKPAEMAKQQMTKRCQNLATFIESIMDDPLKDNDELKLEIQDTDQSCYERDSVMLGGISPHHEYSDSKSSSGTPLSYNQLNYNENLQRYFESHRLNEEDVQKPQIESMVTTNEVIPGTSNWNSKAQESANVSSSNDSLFLTLSASSQKKLSPDFKPLRLTESVISKHNSEMEKELFKKHRELRSTMKGERTKSTDTYQKKKEHLARCNASYQPTSAALPVTSETQINQGLKRTQKMDTNEITPPKHFCNQNRRRCISASTLHCTTSGINSNLSYGHAQGPGIIANLTPCNPYDQYLNNCTSKQPVQGMFGQAVYGQPFLYSAISHPMHATASTSNAHFDTTNTLGLGNSSFDEIFNTSLPSKSPKSIKNFWCDQKRHETKISVMESARGGSTSNSSNNTGRRSRMILATRNFIDKTDGESSYSSFYSSFFKTESGSADDSDRKKNIRIDNKAKLDSTHGYFETLSEKKVQKRKMDPPWMEQVCATPNLMFKYQVKPKSKEEVLKADILKIQKLEQPSLVNEQLGQLYLDLQLEGVTSRLTLEEGITSSSSSGEETPANTTKKYRSKREYSKLVMIYEEDAPLPSPPEFKEPSPGPSKF